MEKNLWQQSNFHFHKKNNIILKKFISQQIPLKNWRVVENGVETVITEEDGVVKSKTVNGVPQSIEFRSK